MATNQLVKFPAGQYIFREGDLGDRAYLIERGRILITVMKEKEDLPVAILSAGELFGEMAIIDGLPRSASAMALEDCELSIISETLLSERVGDSDPILQLLISSLIRRLRSVNMKVKGFEALSEPIDSLSPKLGALARKQLKLENDLLRGLARKEFFLAYQGIFDLKTRQLVGFEALARWQNHERGLVPPNEFIDVAEMTSVILPLGDWILEQGFRDLKILQSGLGLPNLAMSLNVSARQLNDPDFSGRISRFQKIYQIDPKQIKLEVTERVFHEGEHILPTMKKVSDQGFAFAMDDFGTGYSSLTSLFNMKVDTLKIDRSFVSTVIKDPRARTIVQAVVAMALELGVNIVAEGIEHEDEAKLLENLGCHLGQGYLFARPKVLDEVLQIFNPQKSAA